MNTSLAIALCLTCLLMGIIIIAIVVNNQVKCKDKSEPENGSLGKWSFYINIMGIILAIIAVVLIGMQVNKKCDSKIGVVKPKPKLNLNKIIGLPIDL